MWSGMTRHDLEERGRIGMGGPMIEKLYDRRHDVTRDMMQLLSASVSSPAKENQWLPFLLERTQRVKWRERPHPPPPNAQHDPLPSSPCCLEAPLLLPPQDRLHKHRLSLCSPWPSPNCPPHSSPDLLLISWRTRLLRVLTGHADQGFLTLF